MEIEPRVLITLAIIALLAAGVAALVFGANRRGAPGYRILPASSIEWIAYWFHALEFTLICAAFAALFGNVDYGPSWMQQALLCGLGGSALLLLISTVAFWRFDRQMCGLACKYIFWLCIIFLLASVVM